MGFRFRKSVNFGPFRVNLSKSGIGWSVGGKGFRYTKKANGGTRTTYSLPGTGLSYVTETSAKKKKKKSSANKLATLRSGVNCGVHSNSLVNNATSPNEALRGCLWIYLFSWWWLVEYAIWLFAEPVYIVYRYIKFRMAQNDDDVFEIAEVKSSERLQKITSWTLYKTQFYKSDSFFVVMCIFLPVVALLTLLLKKGLRSSKKNIAIAAVLAFWWMILCACCATYSESADTQQDAANAVVSQTDFVLSETDLAVSPSDNTSDITTTTTTTTITTTTATTTTTTTTTATTTTKYVEMVWIPQSGNRYHRKSSCSNMNNPQQVSREKAESMGYTPCGRCY